MQTGNCRCGNRIFFDNHLCYACQAHLGRCMECGSLASFSADSTSMVCDQCHASVHGCANQSHGVCQSYHAAANSLCRWCEFTETVPPLDDPQNTSRWAALESAKRRLLLQLLQLGLPPFICNVNDSHPLRFAFMTDTVNKNGEPKKVTTGHMNGLITINLAEADSVHRERMRVELGEPQRTLVGHMRHEVGHYIDWAWASRVATDEYHRLFGDPNQTDYSDAMDRYYETGPSANWSDEHVSAYATMHPCEDFAETVNAYLDILAIATTANSVGDRGIDLSPKADPYALVAAVSKIALEVNEYNYDLGLLPLLPERLPEKMIEKLAYVHGLRSVG